MGGPPDADVRTVGFNNDVVLGSRTLHVQTEVVGSSGLSVRTMILESGVVHLSHDEPFAEQLGLDDVAALAARQHQRFMNEARNWESH